MQHHIWLTSDAKSLLVLIPGWHKVNMLVVTIIYYFVSRRLYKLTLFLRGMMLPDDITKITHNLVAMGSVLTAFYLVALSLASLGLTSLTYVCIVSMLCGGALYQTIMDATWAAYRDSASPVTVEQDHAFFDSVLRRADAPASSNSNLTPNKTSSMAQIPVTKRDDSVIGRLSPPLIGVMVLFIVGITWQGMAFNGAGKILLLPESCSFYANEGSWVPVNTCNEDQRGSARRDYNLASITCMPITTTETTTTNTITTSLSTTYQWGWHVTPPNELCRFAHRNAKEMKKTFHKRHIIFVGDSMIRNLFYATLRALGHTDAGGYDGIAPKHSDIKQMLGGKSTLIEFRWAPLATNQLDVMRDLNSLNSEEYVPGDVEKRLDLIVMGGGAWDRLHVWATDEDQASHKLQVKELSKEIEGSGTPVVWTVPTVIHTAALQHDDKRDHMKEEDLQEMREEYTQMGVLQASSFVLEGPAFTRDRVSESYDGVHYPPDVYDAGFQILGQALDWLLDPRDVDPDPFKAKQPGSMSNYPLGFMMLCLSFVGLFFFDGFLGFSYLASFFVRGVMPNDLYEEAFTELHQKNNLPPIQLSEPSSHSNRSNINRNSNYEDDTSTVSQKRVDDELNSLLSSQEEDLEMSKNSSNS